MKIAIYIHLFYTEFWDDIEKYLEFMSTSFDLYINFVERYESSYFEKRIKLRYPHAVFTHFPNQGADIGPFIEQIRMTEKQKKEFLKNYF